MLVVQTTTKLKVKYKQSLYIKMSNQLQIFASRAFLRVCVLHKVKRTPSLSLIQYITH